MRAECVGGFLWVSYGWLTGDSREMCCKHIVFAVLYKEAEPFDLSIFNSMSSLFSRTCGG